MKHKLQHIMKEADDELVFEGFVELNDVYWGGKFNDRTNRLGKADLFSGHCFPQPVFSLLLGV